MSLKGARPGPCNLLPAFIEKIFLVTALRVRPSKVEPSFQLNAQISTNGLHGMLEGKDY